MDENPHTVHVSSDVGGIALRVASTTEAQLATHIPSMSVYDAEDALLVRSDKVALLFICGLLDSFVTALS